MKSALALLLLASLACHSHALKCHTCVASNEDDCYHDASVFCPKDADACSTIKGPDTVVKSCTYKGFCNKAQGSSTGARITCCFVDNCNAPGVSAGVPLPVPASAPASSPVLLVTALLLLLPAAIAHL